MSKYNSYFCKSCKKKTLFIQDTPNHVLHLILSIFTAGLWLFVWFFVAIGEKAWHCSTCGSKPSGSGWGLAGEIYRGIQPEHEEEMTGSEHKDCPKCAETVKLKALNIFSIESETKKCPSCAETIKLEAKKCRYCGETFDPEEIDRQVSERQVAEKTAKKVQEYYDKGMDMISKFRTDEGIEYLKRAAVLGHVEAQSFLKHLDSGAIQCERCSKFVSESDIQISRSRKLCSECIKKDRAWF